MLHFLPTSNTERQRQFRERNPGYYQRLHAKRRAEIQAQLDAMAVVSAEAKVVQREQLALPAPAEVIEIPGMTTMGAMPALSPLPVAEKAKNSSPIAKFFS